MRRNIFGANLPLILLNLAECSTKIEVDDKGMQSEKRANRPYK